MIEIRKGKTEEMQQIIDVANKAFAPIREKGFDFRNIMPKTYNNKDSSNIHFILKENGKIVALAGLLPSQIRAGNSIYPFSILGTVSTLPECQGRGHMKQLMRCADEENLKKGYVFNVLTGKRKRYNYFGYEKCSTLYRFGISRYFVNHHVHSVDVRIESYGEKHLDDIYTIFLASNPLIARERNEFVDCLHTGGTSIKVIFAEGKTVGYYALSKRKDSILDLALKDIALLPDVVARIMDEQDTEYLNFQVNPLDFALVEAMDCIAEEKCLADNLHLKVYDMAKFLQLVTTLNLSRLRSQVISECYRIDGVNYLIEVDKQRVSVKQVVTEAQLKDYSAQEFLRKAIGLGDNELCRNSALFPLQFGISEPDLF